MRGDGAIDWGADGSGRRSGGAGRRVLRFARRAAFVAFALAAVWVLVAFLSFRSAVKERNDQVPAKVRAALAPADGPALVTSHVTMLVGADTSAHRRRVGEVGEDGARADTLILMRVDVPSRTVAMLSIPRDLYVDIPGYGKEKINAAYANGGLPLAIRTVRNFTGVDVNHVMQIDFDGFRDIVDALGGIEIDNPHYVASGADGSFDRNERNGVKKPWVFPKGHLKLDGQHALAYARLRKVDDRSLRENEQEGAELGRARRQQRVIDAIVSEVASLESLRHPRGVPRAVVQPLITDASAGQLLAFGFGKWWSKPENNLRCRLGGDSAYENGEDVLIPNEDNRAVVRMWLGKQAPVKPDSALAPGCVRETAAS